MKLVDKKALTHVDQKGKARMVDVGSKEETRREAEARATVTMEVSTARLIHDSAIPKGEVLSVARIAGIMAAKRTAELIPLCHTIALTQVDVDLAVDETIPGVEIVASAHTTGRTGVEMEALTAASVAALTIYDMCKAIDRGMVIGSLRLTRKSGGRSGNYVAE